MHNPIQKKKLWLYLKNIIEESKKKGKPKKTFDYTFPHKIALNWIVKWLECVNKAQLLQKIYSPYSVKKLDVYLRSIFFYIICIKQYSCVWTNSNKFVGCHTKYISCYNVQTFVMKFLTEYLQFSKSYS